MMLCALAAAGAVLVTAPGAFGQVTDLRVLDLDAEITAGTAAVTYIPEFTGDPLKPFDGSAFTELAVFNTDSLQVTLAFDSATTIQQSNVFVWSAMTWTLESATSLSDLDSKTGSYSLLAADHPGPAFAWDSVSFPAHDVSFVRLTIRNASAQNVILGEWSLLSSVTFTHLVIYPDPIRLMTGRSLQLSVKVGDDRGNIHPYFLTAPVLWGTSDGSKVSMDEEGLATGIALGSAVITANVSGVPLSGTSVATVEAEVFAPKAEPMTVKVALVLEDPRLATDRRIHEEFHWYDPQVLANALVRHFREATDSVVNFQFVEIVDADTLFTKFYDHYLGVEEYAALLREPGWSTLKTASDKDSLKFDYRAMVKYYGYDLKRNAGEIDEVWVFAAPYLAMYESQLMGPNAFWWNSPPIKDGTALTKLLSVMGLNYERGVDQAFHSFGHRSESAMSEAFRVAQGKPWNYHRPDPSHWDLFTRVDKDFPGLSHCGNIHFPPNGTSDYNYGNVTLVESRAENWLHYPYLYDDHHPVNVSTWIYQPGEPLAEGNDHLGFLRWWYGHLPRYQGVTDSVLNNWWHYILDFEAAVELAKQLTAVDSRRPGRTVPEGFRLEQNYPNPFNPSTVIEFALPQRGRASLELYDVLGRRVMTLVDGTLEAGSHRVVVDASSLAAGVYFYRLNAADRSTAKKMVVLR
jgi:hypothetical protein